ncbi:hypothetical protein [Lysobacter gummosus]
MPTRESCSNFTAVELISTPTKAGWLFVMSPTVISPCHKRLRALRVAPD